MKTILKSDEYYFLRERSIEVAFKISSLIARGETKLAEAEVTYLSAIIRRLQKMIDNDKSSKTKD